MVDNVSKLSGDQFDQLQESGECAGEEWDSLMAVIANQARHIRGGRRSVVSGLCICKASEAADEETALQQGRTLQPSPTDRGDALWRFRQEEPPRKVPQPPPHLACRDAIRG